MSDDSTTRTSGTLLLRLRELSDRDAWTEFVNRYLPRLFAWCRQRGLQESDAADVSQEVLGKFVGAIRSFDYDPSRGSFRGWLKTVTNNAIRDFVASRSRPGRGSGDSQIGLALATVIDPSAISELTATLDAAAELELLREAEARVQLRVQPHTWEAYRRTVLNSEPATEVARQMNLRVAEIYVAKSRVLKCLREEVARLSE
ncbi:MAG: RNA polymerase sigma factor [Planctomycetaceae bacterium]